MLARSRIHNGWLWTKQMLFRFESVYLVLYALPWPFGCLPNSDWLFYPYNRAWGLLVSVVAKHVLYLHQDLAHATRGSRGDTTFVYVQQLCAIAISAVVALAWTCFRRGFGQRHSWRVCLQLYLRWYVAGQMFLYGLGKVVNVQFPPPLLDRLMQPIGDSSPMGLLWVFMGSSAVYAFFGGALEVIGGGLLMFRRTQLLGALLLLGVLGNVVMLNFCYDVPVKVHSTHLFLMLLYVVTPDVDRLVNFFLYNQPAQPPSAEPQPTWRHGKRVRTIVTFCIVVAQLVEPCQMIVQHLRREANSSPSALYGLYAVESFVSSGRSVPMKWEEDKRWSKVVINQYGYGSVCRNGEPTLHFLMEEDTRKGTLILHPYVTEDPTAPEAGYVLNLSRPTQDVLRVQGTVRGMPIMADLRRVPTPQFLLQQRGFRFVNEYPFNR